jgi:hypothetical protein
MSSSNRRHRASLLAAAVLVSGCGSGLFDGTTADAGAGKAGDDEAADAAVGRCGDLDDCVVVTAVGDINPADLIGPDTDPGRTARSIHALAPDLFLGLGDFQYLQGTMPAILSAYDQNFGDLRAITQPTAGPFHDVASALDQLGYQDYWGRDGFAPYSFDAGAWHIVSLPSAALFFGLDASAIALWLEQDLAASDRPCTLAYWHEPYWSRATMNHPAPDGIATPATRPWLDTLYRHGAEVILNGHQHGYQRFTPMRPDGTADETGLREMVVGTGGAPLYPYTDTAPASVEVSDASTFGVLELFLGADGYRWQFVPNTPGGFTDSGAGACH